MAVRVIEELCIECSGCVFICPNFAINHYDNYPEIEREKCNLCGLCINGCPYGALIFEGKGNG